MKNRFVPPAEETGVDARLKESLPDDLPSSVQLRLERRVTEFVELRKAEAREPGGFLLVLGRFLDDLTRSPVLVRLAVPGAIALVVSGALLQAGGAAAGGSDLISRLSAVASVSAAIRNAGPLLCVGRPGLEGHSPETLSERVYRSWILVESTRNETGARFVFRTPDEPARYELEVDPASFRPRRLRRVEATGEATRSRAAEECTWPETGGRSR